MPRRAVPVTFGHERSTSKIAGRHPHRSDDSDNAITSNQRPSIDRTVSGHRSLQDAAPARPTRQKGDLEVVRERQKANAKLATAVKHPTNTATSSVNREDG